MFLPIILPFLFILSTAAAPTVHNEPPKYHTSSTNSKQCITPSAAELFINRYNAFLTHRPSDLGSPAQTAQKIIAENFIGPYSSSIRSVQGEPGTNGPIYTSKTGLIEGIAPAPPRKISQTLEIIPACEKIIWYFKQATGSGKFPAWGFAVFDVQPTGGKSGGSEWEVSKLRVEFDSVAWVLNEGGEVEFRDGKEIGGGEDKEGEEEGEEGKKGTKEGEGDE